jgi:hypothetical protein
MLKEAIACQSTKYLPKLHSNSVKIQQPELPHDFSENNQKGCPESAMTLLLAISLNPLLPLMYTLPTSV